MQSGNNDKDLVAVTSLDDDKFLGYRCYSAEGKCAHIIVMATQCEAKQQYPVLVNSSSAALSVNCSCNVNSGNNTFELLPLDFNGFHSLLTNSTGYIGFAIPLASGQFKVVRFNLDGAVDAMAAAETVIRKKDSAEYH